MVSGYIEGFLQRERTGPEHLEELVNTLRKLAPGTAEKEAALLRDSIEALARTSESREENASGHGEAVAQYCGIIGRALRLSQPDIRELDFAGRVHDVGKMFVPERVLNKQSSLSEEEFRQLKEHPRLGGEILATVSNGERVHECFDGSGYPAGLRGEEIPQWARILAVADAYANLTTDRPLAPGKSSEQALAELEKYSGTKYDGMLVRILARELKAERSMNLGS